jgi:hypothetical protein
MASPATLPRQGSGGASWAVRLGRAQPTGVRLGFPRVVPGILLTHARQVRSVYIQNRTSVHCSNHCPGRTWF